MGKRQESRAKTARRKRRKETGYERNQRPVFPLVTRPQLALALGWNAITISKLEATEGLPVEIRGAPGKSTVYSLPRVIAWRVAREVSRRLPDPPTPGGAPPIELDTERARLANVQMRRAELDLLRRQGEVALVSDMAAVVGEMLEATKTGLLALPVSQAEPVAAAAREGGPRAVERLMREAITAVLRELAAWRPPRGGGDAPAAAAAQAVA